MHSYLTLLAVSQDSGGDNGSRGGRHFKIFNMLLLLFLASISSQLRAQGVLVNNGNFAGNITLAEIDSFTFEAKAGESVHINVGETGDDTMQPKMTLYNPDGTQEGTDSGLDSAALNCHPDSPPGNCKLEHDGTYSVTVQDNDDNSTGDYEIHFSHMPYANENGPLVNNGKVAGRITLADIDSFTFEAKAGESVHISVGETEGDMMQPRLTLYNPDGTQESTDSGLDSAALNCHSATPIGDCKLEHDGTYRVIVQDDDDNSTGDYEIHFSHMPYANENGYLQDGGVIPGDLTRGDLDTFVFYAYKDDSATLMLEETGSGMQPKMTLYNPDGTQESTDSGLDSAALNCHSATPIGDCKLEHDGIYRVLIEDKDNNNTGNYEIAFTGMPQLFTTPTSINWPLKPFNQIPTVTQDYSCIGQGCVRSDAYHTALDLKPVDGFTDETIYAAAAGHIVGSPHMTCIDPTPEEEDKECNGSYGNTIVVDHGTGIFSLYAHLKHNSLSEAVKLALLDGNRHVAQGQALAQMGETGFATAAHLHWELKNYSGLYWGYRPHHPENYGIYDPWSLLDSLAIIPYVIEISGSELDVYRGPGETYTKFKLLEYGQRFVAFSRAFVNGESWYRIHLPCGKGNSCAGWVRGVLFECGLCDQVEIVGTGNEPVKPPTVDPIIGLPVKDAIGGTVLDKLYDSQRYAPTGNTVAPGDGCYSSWYEIDIPSTNGKSKGWICGDFLHFLPGFPDGDEDGASDLLDNCPTSYNPGQEDSDLDGIGDVCDNCLSNPNPNQEASPIDPENCGLACETGGVCTPRICVNH